MESSNTKLKIALGSDHAGYEYKQAILAELTDYETTNFGTNSPESVDYPDFVHPVASGVASGEFDFGIVVCGSGQGVSMTVNKHPNVRAALCWDLPLAELSRQHNNANIICLPARFISLDLAKELVERFLKTDFEGGRHERRVNKINC